MTENLLEKAYEGLGVILIFFSSKNPNRKYRYKTLLTKLDKAKSLYSIGLSEIEYLPEQKQAPLIKTLRFIQGQIVILINEKLDNNIEPLSFKTLVKIMVIFKRIYNKIKMANVAKIIKIASTLVPDYDGLRDKLKNVTSALAALTPLVTADTEPVAVQVVLSKLTKKPDQR